MSSHLPGYHVTVPTCLNRVLFRYLRPLGDTTEEQVVKVLFVLFVEELTIVFPQNLPFSVAFQLVDISPIESRQRNQAFNERIDSGN